MLFCFDWTSQHTSFRNDSLGNMHGSVTPWLLFPSAFLNVAVEAVGGRKFLCTPKALGGSELTENLAKAVTIAAFTIAPAAGWERNRIRRCRTSPGSRPSSRASWNARHD